MSLELIIGPMFSGKTSRIVSIVSRYQALGIPVLVINHGLDTRYSQQSVSTHDGRKIPSISVFDLSDIDPALLEKYKVLIVDEAQFFKYLVPFVEDMVDTKHKDVVLVGLDGDINRRPFGELLNCIPLADRVEKLDALCHSCADGTPGLFSYRKTGSANQIQIGGAESYETLCRKCYLRKLTQE
jgi:thymidine kinase